MRKDVEVEHRSLDPRCFLGSESPLRLSSSELDPMQRVIIMDTVQSHMSHVFFAND